MVLNTTVDIFYKIQSHLYVLNDVNANFSDLATIYTGINTNFGNVLSDGTENINDVLVYEDTYERDSIHFRLAGPRGACRNVGSIFNDFVYELPKVGVHSLGLTVFTSSEGKDYMHEGIDSWTSNEGVVGPDAADEDDVDETVSDFNCAIKKIGVELDKLRAYRYTLCLREKQVRIYEAGQNKCFEDKCKI